MNVENKLDYRTAQQYINVISTLTKGVPKPLLIDLRDAMGTFSNTAAQLLSTSFNNMPLVLSEAYVVNSLSVKVLVRAFKRLYITKSPYGIFKDMPAARAYCLKFKNGGAPPEAGWEIKDENFDKK